MPLYVSRRKDRGTLEIRGTVQAAGSDDRIVVRRRAGTDDEALAAEEAKLLEAELLRRLYHGERRAPVPFSTAALSYLTKGGPHTEATKAFVRRLVLHFKDTLVGAIDQEAVDKARPAILRRGDDASPATIIRSLITPLRAILHHAARRSWCDPPRFETPAAPLGRVAFLMPDQVEALISAASPHLAPLLTYLVCTGCRLEEALKLEWPDVDLRGARAILWEGETKGGSRRVVQLPPRAVAALAMLPGRDGHVFRTPAGRPYRRSDHGGGGQIKRAWGTACRSAGLPGREVEYRQKGRASPIRVFVPGNTPHDLRHSFASYHYALHRDLLLLQQDGGWADLKLVTRYAHIMPAGHEDAIRAVWGVCDADQFSRSDKMMAKEMRA